MKHSNAKAAIHSVRKKEPGVNKMKNMSKDHTLINGHVTENLYSAHQERCIYDK